MYRNLRDWLRGQALLGALISLSLLTIFTPNQTKAGEGKPSPLSISPVSYNYALLSIPFRPGDKLGLAKRSRNDTPAERVSIPPDGSALGTHNFASPDLRAFSNYASNCVYGKDLQQVCQLLDTPPPAVSLL
ncbi:MAG: hypothetical protein HY668_01805 [Chloroflexi bacterium]|nr:hypothetical protein [Chloroflexota bacterium]